MYRTHYIHYEKFTFHRENQVTGGRYFSSLLFILRSNIRAPSTSQSAYIANELSTLLCWKVLSSSTKYPIMVLSSSSCDLFLCVCVHALQSSSSRLTAKFVHSTASRLAGDYRVVVLQS